MYFLTNEEIVSIYHFYPITYVGIIVHYKYQFHSGTNYSQMGEVNTMEEMLVIQC